MYGYESSATLTTDIFHYKLQNSPLVREGAPRRRATQFSGKRKEKVKSGHGPQTGCPTPRYTDWLAVSRKVTSTSTSTLLNLIYRSTLTGQTYRCNCIHVHKRLRFWSWRRRKLREVRILCGVSVPHGRNQTQCDNLSSWYGFVK
jgi:hypothetical protein